MKIKKHWLAQLDFISVAKNGYIKPEQGFIVIEHLWMGKVTDQKIIKLSGLEEIEVDQAGLLKLLFGFGTMTFKGQGITEVLMFVKNPRKYKEYIDELSR